MWQYKTETLSSYIQKFSLFANQQQLTYAEVIHLWQSNSEFNAFLNSLLANSSFAAYFWETPPITLSTINRNFEFVLVDCLALQKVNSNPHAFKKYFTSVSDKEEIIFFSNLGKNAILVVPCPLIEYSVYTHIANFVRNAPSSQQIALWQNVGKVLQQNLNEKPLWVSTSGLGVYWLHIRLDSYPKYYSFQPYK
jgi:hypothetical protein